MERIYSRMVEFFSSSSYYVQSYEKRVFYDAGVYYKKGDTTGYTTNTKSVVSFLFYFKFV
jgi:hypothetical protein